MHLHLLRHPQLRGLDRRSRAQGGALWGADAAADIAGPALQGRRRRAVHLLGPRSLAQLARILPLWLLRSPKRLLLWATTARAEGPRA